MLAEEYGYQVSPRPAIDTPGVETQLQKFHRSRRRRGLWASFAVLLLTSGILYAFFHDTVYTLPLAFSLLFPPAAVYLSVAREPVLRRRRTLESNRWQVWPCLVEEIETSAFERRVVLLAPDKSAAATFRGTMPEDVWLGMTDGRGVLWIAGDLRFPGVAALPGGAPLWEIKPETAAQRSPAPPANAPGSGHLDALVSEARSVVLWNFLN
ncbi:hypothetical protein [Streptomyces pseudogriseolus]